MRGATTPSNMSDTLNHPDMSDHESAVVECSICYTEAALIEASTACEHEALYCAACLQQHIEAEVNSKGNSTDVSCPAVGCGCQMEYADIQRLATTDVFKTYDRLLLRGMLQSMQNFRFCKAVRALVNLTVSQPLSHNRSVLSLPLSHSCYPTLAASLPRLLDCAPLSLNLALSGQLRCGARTRVGRCSTHHDVYSLWG